MRKWHSIFSCQTHNMGANSAIWRLWPAKELTWGQSKKRRWEFSFFGSVCMSMYVVIHLPGPLPANNGECKRAEKRVGCMYVEAYCSYCHWKHLCGCFSHQQWLTGHESMCVWTESVQQRWLAVCEFSALLGLAALRDNRVIISSYKLVLQFMSHTYF